MNTVSSGVDGLSGLSWAPGLKKCWKGLERQVGHEFPKQDTVVCFIMCMCILFIIFI